MQIWPGQPYPLGATFDGVGTNFSIFSEVAERVELCLFDEAARKPASICRRSPRSAGTATCRRSGRASATATACTAPGRPIRGSGATRTSCCSIRTPRRSRACGTGTRRSFPITSTSPRTRRTISTARRSVPKCVVDQPVLRLGQRSPAEHAVAQDGRLRDARQGVHQAAPGHPRGAARHLRRHGASGRRSSTCSGSASPRSSCCRCTSSCRTRRCAQKELRNYWGYNSIGYLAPHNEYAPRPARRAGAGVQAPGEDAARRRHRGDPRRRLQPHGRRQPPRADAVVQGHRQRRLLPADRRTTAATTWTTPAPATR